jgi:mannose-6-phosphate isomerase-like protein (cupin superfamily)
MTLRRRTFLKSVAAAVPATALHNLIAQTPPSSPLAGAHVVAAGQDFTGHLHSLGFSSLAFKVDPAETAGGVFIIEHRNLLPATGPALHLHLAQDEWFYIMEGVVAFQVGEKRVQLAAGDSVLAPRRIPHTFSAVGSPAHMLIAFTPAGKMQQYFVDASLHPELAATADFMNRYEMRWIGPSPFWKS